MGRGRAPCCDKSKVKRGPWSPAEDMRLVSFIQKNGHENWRSLPKQAGIRLSLSLSLSLSQKEKKRKSLFIPPPLSTPVLSLKISSLSLSNLFVKISLSLSPLSKSLSLSPTRSNGDISITVFLLRMNILHFLSIHALPFHLLVLLLSFFIDFPTLTYLTPMYFYPHTSKKDFSFPFYNPQPFFLI